jgi:hypothetical protein
MQLLKSSERSSTVSAEVPFLVQRQLYHVGRWNILQGLNQSERRRTKPLFVDKGQ